MKKLLQCLLLFLPLITSGLSLYAPTVISDAVEEDADDIEENGMDLLKNFRLPNNTIPLNYKIKITPYISSGNFSFDGESDILLDIVQPTKSIVLHAYDMMMHDQTQLKSWDEEHSFKPIEQLMSNETESLALNFGNEIPPGKYILHLRYTGWLRDDDNGFYQAFYEDKNGNEVYLASTFFEAHNARRAFPCWDEPALKATFDISIKHYPNYTAVSNMPVLKEEPVPIEGKKWTIFETSPVMSTYLVAYVVSDYANLTADVSNVSIGFFARKNAISEIEYPFQIGQKALPMLEEYTNISYSLPKLDSLAIPQFASGAVENWGAITYLESSLLVSDEKSPFEKETAARMVIHEYAHQWFGNLVSPRWWKYFWLNEGFATYMENTIIDKLENYKGMLERFVVLMIQQSALPEDSLKWTVPLNADVHHFKQISNLRNFFTISYTKGAAILHMLAHVITDRIFRIGVHKYLQANKYGAVTTDELWAAMQEAVDEVNDPQVQIKVKEVMDPWVNQAGHPLVSVVRNYTDGSMSIRQARYVIGAHRDQIQGSNNNSWWVPITLTSQADANFSATIPSHWLSPSVDALVIDQFSPDGWIILDLQSTGFYHVNYDEENWRRLARYLDSESRNNIHVLNRAKLLNDARILAKNFDLDVDIFMDIFESLKTEANILVWFAAFESIDFIIDRTVEYFRGGRQTVKNYLSQIMDDMIQDVGFENMDNESQLRQVFRIYLSHYACILLEHPKCREKKEKPKFKKRKGFMKYLANKNFEHHKFAVGIVQVNEENWNLGFDVYKRHPSDMDMLNTLASTENPKLALKLLKFIIDESAVPVDRVAESISTVLLNNRTVDFALNFLAENKNGVIQRLSNETSGLRSIFREILRNKIKTQGDLTAFRQVLDGYRDEIGDKLDEYVEEKLKKLKNMKAREQGQRMFERILKKLEGSSISNQGDLDEPK